MSVLGKKSGEVRSQQAAVDDVAVSVLEGPQMQGIKMALGAIGVDIDDMIEKHGPTGTIAGLSQLAGFLGIDIGALLSGGLDGLGKGLLPGVGQRSNVDNPYLKA